MPASPEESSKLPKPKPVYVTLVKDGLLKKQPYSFEAALKQGVLDKCAYAILDSGLPTSRVSGGIQCPHCDYTQRDFERTGRLGCPQCAEHFRSLLMPLIERMHKDTHHVGKVPACQITTITLRNELKKLNTSLEQAIAEERYEEAAKLRDRLEQVECELEEARKREHTED